MNVVGEAFSYDTCSSRIAKTGDDLLWQPWAATAGFALAILVAGLRLRRREDGRRIKR